MPDYLRFLNRLTWLTARQMRDESGINAEYEIRAISQLCPSVFSSFEHSFFSMKACANSPKAILAVNDITDVGLKTFHG
jgi:hypothetical protein